MKILICHNFYRQIGGEDMAVEAQIQLLQKQGHIIQYFFKRSWEIQPNSLFQKIQLGFNGIYSKTSANEFRRTLSDFRPDVVHIHNVFPLISPSIYTVLQQEQIPIVQTIHNFRWLCPNGLFYTQGHLCTRCANGNILPAIQMRCLHDNLSQSIAYALALGASRTFGWLPTQRAQILTLNQFTARLLQKHLTIPNKNISILGNFLEDIPFTHTGEVNNRFVYMGRLSPEKGVITILEAARLFPQAQFDIIGTGPSETELRAYAASHSLSNVHFWGFQKGEERFRSLHGATALLLPSVWHEQFPMVILEAFRMGVPVIATRMGGLPDIVSEGETGLLFDPGDANGLVNCLKKLCLTHTLQRALGQKAREHFINHHSETAYYPNLMSIYQQAIG